MNVDSKWSSYLPKEGENIRKYLVNYLKKNDVYGKYISYTMSHNGAKRVDRVPFSFFFPHTKEGSAFWNYIKNGFDTFIREKYAKEIDEAINESKINSIKRNNETVTLTLPNGTSRYFTFPSFESVYNTNSIDYLNYTLLDTISTITYTSNNFERWI